MADQDIWDVYSQHLAGCSQCKTQYDLQEEGDKEECCSEGRSIIRELETQFWNALLKKKN